MEIKKYILLEDEVSEWLQILMMASSLDVKGNKAIQKNCFSRYLVDVPKYGPIVLKKWAYVGIFKTY